MTESTAVDARTRMLMGAVEVLRERGLRGTSFRELLARCDAPRGSIYHHFPGGKDQLVVQAIAMTGQVVADHLRDAASAGGSEGAIGALFAGSRRQLERSDFRQGCPVGAVSAEVDGGSAVGRAAAEAFEAWRSVLVEALRADGHGRAAAERLAELAVSMLEGAILVCRVRQSSVALDTAERHLLDLARTPA